MLSETAGLDVAQLSDIKYTGYAQRKAPGWRVRLFQTLHIVLRPISLVLSAHFARRFNEYLYVDAAQLEDGLASVEAGDCVLWINPTLALCDVIDGLQRRSVRLHIYFLDPIHRLGLTPGKVRAWALEARISTYSPKEAACLGIDYLVPYIPGCAPTQQPRDLDVVYVGSPTPMRLLWVMYLRVHLRVRGRKGYLRLAIRNRWIACLLPSLFSERVPFADYVALCARSRGVLELHERDAGGVTLRATLCQALGAVHLCNLATTAQTVQVSPWRCRKMDDFLVSKRTPGVAPALPTSSLELWLRSNFA